MATDLRALTVRWPWVAPIAFPSPDGLAPKRVENRTRPTSYTGPILIHAGKAWDPYHSISAAMRDWIAANCLDQIDMAYCEGKILAVANLTGCHPSDGACCRPWGEPAGVYHWLLANVRQLAEPVPCRGRLGLWRPTADVAQQVLAQVEVTA